MKGIFVKNGNPDDFITKSFYFKSFFFRRLPAIRTRIKLQKYLKETFNCGRLKAVFKDKDERFLSQILPLEGNFDGIDYMLISLYKERVP